jgi:membrane protein implicated in regulation of membrane protease activity
MLIVALVLAVIGLAALVTAVVTSNELIAWVCIGASVIGVLLLIVDALRERSRGGEEDLADADDRADETTVIPAVTEAEAAEDYPDEPSEAETSAVTVDSNDDSGADAKRD